MMDRTITSCFYHIVVMLYISYKLLFYNGLKIQTILESFYFAFVLSGEKLWRLMLARSQTR